MLQGRITAFVVVALLAAMAGCDRQPAAPPEHRINAAMVVSDRELLHKDKAVLNLFRYGNPDARGWPTDATEQHVVRLLQDNGITVAFSDIPGEHHVMVGIGDSPKMAAARKAVISANLNLSTELRRAFGLDVNPSTQP